MKTQMKNKRWSIIAITILLIALGGGTAYATPPTEAGTMITTLTTDVEVNFKVGGIDQPLVNATADYAFMVDNKIDHTMSVDNASVSITPGSEDNALKFKLKNMGNKDQSYIITRYEIAGTMNANNIEVWYDSGPNFTDGNIETKAGLTKITNNTNGVLTYFNVAFNNESAYIYVTGDFNNQVLNSKIANMEVVAQACDLGTTTFTNQETIADTYNTEQVVWADGDGDGGQTYDAVRDGKYSYLAKFVVSTATLGVSKTSSVIWDPFNLAVNPKRIPGAKVRYITTISNSGGAMATSIELVDSINTEVSAGTIAYNTESILLRAPNRNGNIEFSISDTNADGDQGYWNATNKEITVGNIELDTDESATIKFDVTIQ